MSNEDEFLQQFLSEYLDRIGIEFESRMRSWDQDIFDKEVNDVVGGLMARQVTLAIHTAISPQIWNQHVLPLFLRTMADVYISFSWILLDTEERARKFIEYGLGQEKLELAKHQEAIGDTDEVPNGFAEFIQLRKQLLDNERLSFLIPVNLGAWSEINTRKMAIEIDDKQFYDFVFTPFSSCVHSTWAHVSKWNLQTCTNPLHMLHRVPVVMQLPMEPKLFANSAKYLCKTFKKFDESFGDTSLDSFALYDFVCDQFSTFAASQSGSEDDAIDCTENSPS